MAEIAFDHVSEHFGTVEAVRELSLLIGEGEFLVLLGPSGSGKTTALRMLSGHVYLDGTKPTKPTNSGSALVIVLEDQVKQRAA
jgi:ABC-type Fe3+/spermidine/putrescine transport system ATPase subunit